MDNRDDLAALLLHAHPLVSEGMADKLARSVLAAGWMTEDRWTEEAEAAALAEVDADGRSTNPGLARVTAERDALAATIQRVRAVCDEADAMSPEDYKTGQEHLPPAFREINYPEAFMALAKIVNRIESALDGAGEEDG